MHPVELRILGGFELRVDGVVVDVQPGLQKLTAFVALASRGIDRNYVAFQLWPDKTEARAKANLRSTLWRLGKLDRTVLTACQNRLRLAEHVWVDALHGVRDLRDEGDTGIVDDMLPFAVLQSELLPDWYDDWLVVERERLRQLSLATLETRARNALGRGDSARSIQTALAAVSIDPLRESARRIVIQAHLAEGNQYEALRELESYRTILRCDPHLTVSTELLALFDPASDATVPEAGAADLPVAV